MSFGIRVWDDAGNEVFFEPTTTHYIGRTAVQLGTHEIDTGVVSLSNELVYWVDLTVDEGGASHAVIDSISISSNGVITYTASENPYYWLLPTTPTLVYFVKR